MGEIDSRDVVIVDHLSLYNSQVCNDITTTAQRRLLELKEYINYLTSKPFIPRPKTFKLSEYAK